MTDIEELRRLNEEATPGPWRYEIQYGPEGEANYAWVYSANNKMIGTFKTHHAAFIAAMRNALPELLAKAEVFDRIAIRGGSVGDWVDSTYVNQELIAATLAKLGGRDE